MVDSKCSVGHFTISECHKLSFSQKIGIKKINLLSKEEKELLRL